MEESFKISSDSKENLESVAMVYFERGYRLKHVEIEVRGFLFWKKKTYIIELEFPLHQQLQVAINEERYEDAAIIRDKINNQQ